MVLEYFEVELVELVPNSITILSVFVYLCEAYLGIASDLDIFRYYYRMGKHRSIAVSCGFQLHDGMSREYILMFTRSSWPGWRKEWFYWTVTKDDSLYFKGKTTFGGSCHGANALPRFQSATCAYYGVIFVISIDGTMFAKTNKKTKSAKDST